MGTGQPVVFRLERDDCVLLPSALLEDDVWVVTSWLVSEKEKG